MRFALDVGTDYFGDFEGFHAYYTVPAACGDEGVVGNGTPFSRLRLMPGMSYRISLVPAATPGCRHGDMDPVSDGGSKLPFFGQ